MAYIFPPAKPFPVKPLDRFRWISNCLACKPTIDHAMALAHFFIDAKNIPDLDWQAIACSLLTHKLRNETVHLSEFAARCAKDDTIKDWMKTYQRRLDEQ